MPSSTPALVGNYFALPFFPPQREGLRGPRKGKRKRSGSATDDDGSGGSEAQGPDPVSEQLESSTAIANLPPNDREQYRVAGQPFNKEPPGGEFPHRSTSPPNVITPTDIASELEEMNPPLHHPTLSKVEVVQTSEKQRHVAVLTTILHKCLLKGDYLRAARAFGMLLRSEVSGRQLDIRESGLWGLGVEVLLQKALPERDGEISEQIGGERKYFSRKGFGDAREYLERLILTYPVARLRPNAVDFYPTLFGLWIGAVQDQQIQAFERLRRDRSSEDSDGSDEPSRAPDMQDRQAGREVYTSVLSQAREIGKRLQEVLGTPSFPQDTYLVQLKDAISHWITDIESKLESG